ncbi:hypothetical protein BDC45DRAFT_523491 [Circinella umbellata]|nr:hypothetical protein BDC45DRAFT_523491 [Circinella umbellata]
MWMVFIIYIHIKKTSYILFVLVFMSIFTFFLVIINNSRILALFGIISAWCKKYIWIMII